MDSLSEKELKEVPILPVEVWTEVLKYVPSKLDLMLVSKTFYEAVKTIENNEIFASINCFDIKSSIQNIEEKVQNKSELNIQLISPNFCTLDFLKRHGNQIKILKIKKKCKIKDFLDILSLIPNCESLDIASIEFDGDNGQFSQSQTLKSLKELHIDISDDLNDNFWKCLSSKVLEKLIVAFDDLQKFQKLEEFFNNNHQLKVLDLKLKKDSNAPDIIEQIQFNSLKSISLDTINAIRETSSCKNDWDKFLAAILRSQPELKHLNVYGIDERSIETMSSYNLQLESLELADFIINYDVLKKIANLTKLRTLILRDTSEYDKNAPNVKPEFFSAIAQNNRDLKHLELNGNFFFNDDSLPSILSNFKQLESLKIFAMCQMFLSSSSVLPLNIENANLKVLNFFANIPIRLFAKFTLSFPNLEDLFMHSLSVSYEDSYLCESITNDNQTMSDLIKKAKNSTENPEKVVAELIEPVLMRKYLFDASDFLRLQMFLIQLGWKKLKVVKLGSARSYENLENQLEELINANKDLQLLQVGGQNATFNKEEYHERFHKRFNEITNDQNKTLFEKFKDCNKTPAVKIIKIKNYSKCDFILNADRIKNFKLNFSERYNEKVFKYYEQLIEKHGKKILDLELIGTVNANQLECFLNSTTNCEKLYLNEVFAGTDLSHEINLPKLKTLIINKGHFNVIKWLRKAKLNTLVITEISWLNDKINILNNFLKDQTMLKTLTLDINFIYRGCDDISIKQCKLEKLTLKYSDHSSLQFQNNEKQRNVVNLLTDQTQLKSLEIGYMSEQILNVIIKDLKKLKILKIQRIIIEHDYEISEICPSVEFLQFKDKPLSNYGMDQLAQIFPNIKTLVFFETTFRFTLFIETVQHFHQLESLSIKRQRTILLKDVDDFYARPTFINANVKELTYDFRFKKTSVEVILECLPNLQKLALNCLNFITGENEEETVKCHLKTLFSSSNNIEYLYYKIDKEIKIESTQLSMIEQKENLKFLYLEGIEIENCECLLDNLRNSFKIVEIDQKLKSLLLVKSKEILQEIFDSTWNEAGIRTNQQIRQILNIKKFNKEYDSYDLRPAIERILTRRKSVTDCDSDESYGF